MNEQSFVEREPAYFDENAPQQSEQSSVPGLLSSPVPLLFVNAALDPPYFMRRATALQAAFTRAHRRDRFVVLPGHNHMSDVFSINTEDNSVSGEIEHFIQR